MSQTWSERNIAWASRAAVLGRRAVLHVGHKTTEQQLAIFQKQAEVILPKFEAAFNELRAERVKAGKAYHLFRTLDYGCGVGRWTRELAELTGGSVLGVDPTEAFLDICRHDYGDDATGTIAFERLVNGRVPAENGAFDVVYACMVLSTVLDVEGGMFTESLREIERVLSIGGLMFLVDNTAGRGGREVRSPYSISRTVKQYRDAFNEHVHVDLKVVGEYEDLGEINTIFVGRKR